MEKIFQNLNNLDKLDVSVNSISIIYYDGLNRLSYLNIGHNNLRELPNVCPKMILLLLTICVFWT